MKKKNLIMNFLHSTQTDRRSRSIDDVRYVEIVPSFVSKCAIQCVNCSKYIKSSKHRCAVYRQHQNVCTQPGDITTLMETIVEQNIVNIVEENWCGQLCLEHESLEKPVFIKIPTLCLVDDNPQLLGMAKIQDDFSTRSVVFRRIDSYTKGDFIKRTPVGLLILNDK